MMKKLFITLTLLTSLSSFAETFNPDGEIFCQTYMGNYDNVGKLLIKEKDLITNKRDLSVFGVNYADSCTQIEDSISCRFKSNSETYSLQVNIKNGTVTTNNFDDIDGFSINDPDAFLDGDHLFSRSKKVRCEQFVDQMQN